VRRLKGVFPLAVVFLLVLTAPHLYALELNLREGPVFIEADSISHEGADDSYVAKGNVLITFSGGYLKADSVTFYRTVNKALAVGNVELKSDNDLIDGDKVFFNIGSKTGVVEDGGMFISENHLYVRGERIEKKSEASYSLEKGTVTTCDGEHPDWRIAAKEMDITVDGYGTLKHGRFLAGDIPLLYFPWLIFPAKTTRQTGFLFPHLAYSSSGNGMDIEVPFYWAISESADMTFYQRYMEKRGFKEGMEFRYYIDHKSSGVFYGDFINDRKTTTEDDGTVNQDLHNGQRWSYYFNHETTLPDGLKISADLNRVSDHGYFRDFEAFNYYLEHYSVGKEDRFRRISFKADESISYLYSTFTVTKDWQLYNLTALAKYTDDFSTIDNAATLQKYPEVILTGFRRPLFDSNLEMDFTTGYDYYYSDEGQRGHLWELNPTLYLPFNLWKYFPVTPWTGIRMSAWDRTDSLAGAEGKNGERNLFNVGATVSTEFNRVFTVNSESLEKLRHVIKPELTYQYIHIPRVYDKTLPSFLGAIYPYNAVTYGVINTLTAKMKQDDGKTFYRELLRFKVSQAYDIIEAKQDYPAGGKENRPFGDIITEFDAWPSPFVWLSARNTFDVTSGGQKQNNYDIGLSDSRGDSISVGYRYTRYALEGFNLFAKAEISKTLQLTYLLNENRLDHRTLESTIGMLYRKQCWTLGLSVSEEDGEGDKKDRRFMVYFWLLGLGMNN
jgi:LPS-assembly protein